MKLTLPEVAVGGGMALSIFGSKKPAIPAAPLPPEKQIRYNTEMGYQSWTPPGETWITEEAWEQACIASGIGSHAERAAARREKQLQEAAARTRSRASTLAAGIVLAVIYLIICVLTGSF